MATSSGPGAGSWDIPTRPDNSPLTAQCLLEDVTREYR